MRDLLSELRECYGQDAKFRDGQEEAINSVLDGKRTLVVQKTGWGKSLVYFLATKIIRRESNKITLIISPLLALMNNQIESASKLGMKVKTLNSENTEDWDLIIEEINNNNVDALIISPERLANDDFKKILTDKLTVNIGLFVVDEAHCISDWGHDFRPDYRRIIDIVNLLPSNIPVLATTATANNRVVNDIKAQLGNDIIISRGDLIRKSLAIQVIKLASKEERLAWLSNNLKDIPGTGIIYCLTVNDCKLVEKWLKENEYACESYYAAVDKERKMEIIDKFMKNQIKVLVATVAFGMGFDKKDISFVIHFQKPANIVAYYQQIGRAGRAIDKSYAILFCGSEDEEISNYFIDSAFPTEKAMDAVIHLLSENQGLKMADFEKYLNMKRAGIEKCIKYLLVNGDIYKDGSQYYKTLKPWEPDLEKSEEITVIRKNELKQMNEFVDISDCYMKYIANALDDSKAEPCGCCANCKGQNLFAVEPLMDDVTRAQLFIKNDFNIIEPRKKWPATIKNSDKNTILSEQLCEQGRVLSNYGDAGWGKHVADCKYKIGAFDEQLVDASVELLNAFVAENEIKWVTSIPSLRRPKLVRDFAISISDKLGLPYVDSLIKKDNSQCQKELHTSYLQYKNANDTFDVLSEKILGENVLLIDDMVDSRWTFTVCGYKLRSNGCGKVYPFALANTAGRNEGE
ncbi:MAG: RecQ family ATP-dependent DNA helicase [Clostridium sp.]|nr:RecQ family ATP-dependent DNA helicase [Clostridium sp.]